MNTENEILDRYIKEIVKEDKFKYITVIKFKMEYGIWEHYLKNITRRSNFYCKASINNKLKFLHLKSRDTIITPDPDNGFSRGYYNILDNDNLKHYCEKHYKDMIKDESVKYFWYLVLKFTDKKLFAKSKLLLSNEIIYTKNTTN